MDRNLQGKVVLYTRLDSLDHRVVAKMQFYPDDVPKEIGGRIFR
jgi:hypothetical protein